MAAPSAYGSSQPGVELELQLLAYATATATVRPDPRHILNLHRSLWQHQFLNPLSKARDGTWIHVLPCNPRNKPVM